MLEMKLHIRMAEKRINQRQLSEITGIRIGTISGYYNNKFKHIVAEHLEKFCEFFDCNVEDLIEYKK